MLATSVSLGYECLYDAQCQSADVRSICSKYKGVCICGNSNNNDNNIGSTSKTTMLKLRLRQEQQLSRVKRRSPKWFCNPQRPRLCPKGTFQVI